MLDTTQALDQFLAGIERRAFRMAMVATGSHSDALDIVQDAMLKLVQRYRNRPQTEWGPLFHTILQSRIRDWYRRSKIRNRWRQFFGGGATANETSIEDFADPAPQQTETRAENKQMINTLEIALHQLPARQQQAFLLRAWEELSVKETAKAMGCSVGSVKTHFSRAVHSLRDTLGGDFSDR